MKELNILASGHTTGSLGLGPGSSVSKPLVVPAVKRQKSSWGALQSCGVQIFQDWDVQHSGSREPCLVPTVAPGAWALCLAVAGIHAFLLPSLSVSCIHRP